MAIPIFFVAHWYLSLFAQTVFLHRYAAHRMFTLNKFWERIFFLFTYITQGTSFLNPRAYAILHRLHHAYSDTERDPHSPVVHPNILKMMWRTKVLYNAYMHEKIEVSKDFLASYPHWRRLEAFAEGYFSRVMWGAAYFFFYVFFANAWYWYLLLPLHFLMGPIHGAIVNYFGHKLGYTNFRNNDNSKNTLVFDFLMLGELFQNNHHRFPLKTNFAARWFEWDPAYVGIKALARLGILRLRLKSRKEQLVEATPVDLLDTSAPDYVMHVDPVAASATLAARTPIYPARVAEAVASLQPEPAAQQ